MQGTAHADFVTPEYTTTPPLEGKKFEVCRGIGTSFGYNEQEDDSSYASSTELIHMLINIVAAGGNFLLNVGPMASGEIPWIQQERLLTIGQWLQVNGAAIYASHPHEITQLSTAEGETGHAHGHLEYMEAVGDPATGLPIGTTSDNLKAAVAGETHEYTDMYPGMAKTARDEGFDEIADWFETLAKAERSHANRFQKALDAMD